MAQTSTPRTPSAPRWQPGHRPLSMAACLAGLAGLAWLPGAGAQTMAPAASSTMYLQHGADSATLGVTLPWRDWRRALRGGQLTGYWDLWAGRWSAPFEGRDRATWVIGVNPTLRWHGDGGQSRWFGEAGVGLSWALHRRYATDHKEFATRYNFATHLGVGYLFGAQRQHELVLRLEHHSNAGIKKPNPGENFLQLRYARHF